MAIVTPPTAANGALLQERLAVCLEQFGFAQLTEKQESAVRAILAEKDALVVLPTGAGKSACFQIPGVVMGWKVLVISPLIALQEDQVASLRRIGVHAFALHSGLDDARRKAVHFHFKTVPEGVPSFLYVSPELLMTEAFHKLFDGVKFDLAAIDEAHCVSTWGSSFRPDYLRIKVAVRRLGVPRCCALTATVDARIERDICKYVPLKGDHIKIAADPSRPNLLLSFERPGAEGNHVAKGKLKFQRLFELLDRSEYAGPVIVYSSSRPGVANLYLRTEKMRGFLARTGYTPLLFHAGLPYEDKERALQVFLEAAKPVMFATSAFGMGVNRPDIRQVVHYQPPFTLIDYAQQIGRGGRDGSPTLCSVFCPPDNLLRHREQFANFQTPDYTFVERVYENLRRTYLKLEAEKRRQYNLHTFLSRTRAIVDSNNNIIRKDHYMARFGSALFILKRAGLIVEDGDGLAVFKLLPGSPQHTALLNHTSMAERMTQRESDRVRRFFSGPADQQLLWQILQEK